MRILTLPGVFQPRSDALLLAATTRERGLARRARVLDLFTGSGALALAAAREGARAVTAVDVSRRAVLTVRINARRNGLRVRALRGDLFAPVDEERFDLILANPPYLPSAAETLPRRGAARAWEGGPDGRALIDRLAASAAVHLRPDGTLLLVHSSLCGERETLERLAEGGLRGEVLVRRRGPLGPLLQARAKLLEERGLLARGRREEHMLVIAATVSPEAARGSAEGATQIPHATKERSWQS